jgi:tetratricopeptide (TPR) repeat protein
MQNPVGHLSWILLFILELSSCSTPQENQIDKEAVFKVNQGMDFLEAGVLDSAVLVLTQVSKSSCRPSIKGASFANLGDIYSEFYPESKSTQTYYSYALGLFSECKAYDQLARTKLNFAIHLKSKGAYSLASEYISQSIDFFRSKKEYKTELAIASDIAGNLQREIGNYREASAYYNESLELKEQGTSTYYRSVNNLGNLYVKDDKYHKAKDCYTQYLEFAKNNNDSIKIARAQNNLSIVALHSGNLSKATKLNDDAYSLFHIKNYKLGQLSCQILKGKIESKKSSDIAISTFQKALLLAENCSKVPEEIEIHQHLSTAYNQMNDPRKSLRHSIHASTLKDSLFNLKAISEVHQANLDSRIYAKNIQLISEKAAKEKSLLLIVLLIIVLLFAGAASYYFYKNMRKLSYLNGKIGAQNTYLRDQFIVINSIKRELREEKRTLSDKVTLLEADKGGFSFKKGGFIQFKNIIKAEKPDDLTLKNDINIFTFDEYSDKPFMFREDDLSLKAFVSSDNLPYHLFCRVNKDLVVNLMHISNDTKRGKWEYLLNRKTKNLDAEPFTVSRNYHQEFEDKLSLLRSGQ